MPPIKVIVKGLLCLGEQPSTATSTPTQPAPQSVTIDAIAFPHILDSIFRAAITDASDRELMTIRSVSKEWRLRIDAILGRHLILDAWDNSQEVATYLHDGQRAPLLFDVHPHSLRPFQPQAIAAPVLAHTKILDIHNHNAKGAIVMATLIPLLPVLDILRLYPQDMVASTPIMPPARRVVVFFDLTYYRPPLGQHVCIKSPVLFMEELVVHFYPLCLNINPDPVFCWWYGSYILAALDPWKVTIIFRDNGPACRPGPLPWGTRALGIRLAQLIEELPRDSDITVVGLETYAEDLGFEPGEVVQQLADHRARARVTFIDLRTYQEQIGAETWTLYSETTPEREVREWHRDEGASSCQPYTGTAIRGKRGDESE